MSTASAYLDDAQLRAAVLDRPVNRRGWSAGGPAQIAGCRVFVKRIPLTEVERAHMFSTRNRFRLPGYYNYGVGSAGFGVFRELAGVVKTTNWVLEGAIESFPLLYHARVMLAQPAADPRFEPEAYVRRWNGSKAVANYMTARAESRHEMWLILEHFPHTLGTWLPAHQNAAGRVIDELCRTIEFLRSHGIVHFDAHPWNVVGDDERVYLTDFGLVLDPQFELAERERTFLAAHSHYDYGEVIAGLGQSLLGMVRGLEPDERARVEKQYGLDPKAPPHLALARLLDRLDDLQNDRALPLDRGFADLLSTHRDVIIFMSTFLTELQRNPRKNTRYDDAALRRLLASAGVVPAAG